MAKFHASLNTPVTFLGGDRELMMGVMGIAIMMVFVYKNWFGVGIGIAIWAIGAYALRKIAHNDAMFRHVYRRSLRYRTYMPAQAHYDSPYPETLGKE